MNRCARQTADLLHLAAKKLGRIERPSQRVTGNRRTLMAQLVDRRDLGRVAYLEGAEVADP